MMSKIDIFCSIWKLQKDYCWIINKRLLSLVKQYVGLVIIVKELTRFWIYHFLSFNW